MKWTAFFILLLLIVVRYQSAVLRIPEGSTVILRGTISREPTIYDSKILVSVNNTRAYISRYPEVTLGDYIELKGIYERGIVRNSSVLKLTKSTSPLYKLRESLLAFYEKSLPLKDAALISGVVIGSQSGIDKDFQEELTRAGVIHVVVASGTNVVFVSVFITSILLLFFKRRSAILLSIVGVWGYVFLSGFSPPLVRAALMGGVAIVSQLTGRLSSNIRNLVIVCLLMLLVNPLWITDLGFIMSVLATLGLILFETKVNRLIRFVPQLIRQDLSTTLAAQIGVLPILVGVFGNFNLLSPIVNVLVLWTIPPIMILGSVAGVFGLVYTPLGKTLLFITYPLTQWFVNVVQIFSGL